MNTVEQSLFRTRKSLLDLQTELGVECILDSEITLSQCTSCGIWLKPSMFRKDLDGLDICNECYTYYGP